MEKAAGLAGPLESIGSAEDADAMLACILPLARKLAPVWPRERSLALFQVVYLNKVFSDHTVER